MTRTCRNLVRPRRTARSLALLALLAPSIARAAAAPSEDLAARAEALLAEKGSLLLAGRAEDVVQGVDETVALYERLGDPYGQAAGLVVRGLARWGEGSGRATVRDLEAGLALLEDAGDPLGSWLVLWLLAEAEYQEGRLESSEARLRKALDLLAELRASPEPLDFRGLEKLGRACGAQVELLQALGPASDFLKPILVGFLDIPLRSTLVGVLTELERLAEAETELGRAVAGAALFGGLFDSDLHLRRGELRRRQWRLDEARASFERALAAPSLVPLVPSARGDVAAWKALDGLAEVESLAGRAEEALAWNERALELARESQNRSREALVLENRARIFTLSGKLDPAVAVLLEAEAITREIGDRYRLANVLGELGSHAMMQADYEGAAAYLERSVALLEELHEPFVAAPTLLLLVEAYQMLEAHERTEVILDRAGKLAEVSEFGQAAALADALSTWNRFRAGDADRVELRESLTTFLESSRSLTGPAWPAALILGLEGLGAGEIEEAEEVAGRLLSSATSPSAKAFARLAHGVALLSRGEAVAAEEDLDAAARAFAALGQRDLEGMARAALAGLQWRDGRRDQATRSLEAAVTAFETVVSKVQVEELTASFLGGGRGFLYGLLVDMLAEAERPGDAFLQAERSRSRALLRLLGNQRLRPPARGDSALAARADVLRARIREWERALIAAPAGEAQRLENDLHHARREYEDLLVRLKVQSPEYAALASVDPASLEEVQAALEPGVTLVSYFLTRAGSYAWVVERERFEMVRLPLEAADLPEAACWARELGRPRAEVASETVAEAAVGAERGVTVLGGCAPVPDRAERLYGKLLAPLTPSSLGPRLVIVPHGPLHYLPFAALRDPETGRYLVQDHELTLAPSASVIPLLRDKESPVQGRALVLGAPAIDDRGLPPLRGAEEEAVAVAALFGVEPRLGPAATEASVFDSAGDLDLLHLAAHGVYHPGAPRFSRILLAAGGGHDGSLEVYEVFAGLDLSGVNLVALSACRTASGPDAGGDEIVSLARAFLYAGSPGVLSTLWPVPDRPSAELLKGFYRRLLGGEPAAAALRGAQLEMLRDGPRHPYFWAGYTLTGDPRARWRE